MIYNMFICVKLDNINNQSINFSTSDTMSLSVNLKTLFSPENLLWCCLIFLKMRCLQSYMRMGEQVKKSTGGKIDAISNAALRVL